VWVLALPKLKTIPLVLKMTGTNAAARAENARTTQSGFFVCNKADKHKTG